ncbi:hypothetical protein DKT75_04440 [Leucothrix arctica]|uniref:Peptidase C39-like domain-containing protein n=2 Tax=Leucothrix arctica TaxID=1481894 RepID=A0A317CJL7_9GAMM|nr:hypothetical protein DKT75_04440 [Leucothrix arctica]
MCASLSAFSSESIDPKGEFFVQRTRGDTLHCGPLAAIMARNFADTNYKPQNTFKEIKSARGLVNDFLGLDRNKDFGRWWEFADIETYLNFMGVRYKSTKLTKGRNTESQIKKLLDQQQMVLVNVNMNHIPRGKNANKPYSTFYIPGGWGHFLAVVGYEYKDEKLYFEMHDSFSPNGRNRLYEAKYIIGSMKKFEPEFLQIERGV